MKFSSNYFTKYDSSLQLDRFMALFACFCAWGQMIEAAHMCSEWSVWENSGWQAAICARSVCALEMLIDQHMIKTRGKNFVGRCAQEFPTSTSQGTECFESFCEVFGGTLGTTDHLVLEGSWSCAMRGWVTPVHICHLVLLPGVPYKHFSSGLALA